MDIVQVGYGKVTYDVSSASLTAFVLEPPFQRTLASKILTKTSQTLRIPASSKPQFDGWLYQDNLNAPDGTLMLVQLQVRNHGVAVRDGAIFLRTRNTGPLVLITANLPVNIRSSPEAATHTAFTGKADILAVDDLSNYDIEPSRNYLNAFTNDEELEECFTISAVTQGTPMPRLETATNAAGDKVVFVVPRLTRRIRIRK